MEENKINGISCGVCNCCYHTSDNCCCAGQIKVGPEHACNCNETVCATFEAN
ncbi:MAG: DUF1540 domain-containing protein [Oscillospiraceae bacterium]